MIAGQILSVAERRRARALVVRLSCRATELFARIAAEERANRLKTTDVSQAERLARLEPLNLNHDWIVDLDTTHLRPEAVADVVMAELSKHLIR
jgi:hypothetical protein